MLNSEGFDLWADSYDRAVGLSDEDGSYPFAGYRAVLNHIYNRALSHGTPRVLDLGFGTGALTAMLYARGCEIWGQDFSERMIALAQPKMPLARLYSGDFSRALAAPLLENAYDVIVATYALHHLDFEGKARLIRRLQALLAPGGEILIGDVAFESAESQARCRAAAGDKWDDEECYFIYDEMVRAFPGMTFEKLSHCAGVLALGPSTNA